MIQTEVVEILRTWDYAGTGGGDKVRVGVVPFTDLANRGTGLSGLASELILERMLVSGRFLVVDSAVLDDILREQNIGAAGRSDPSTAAKVGKIIQPQVLLYGKVGIVDGVGVMILSIVEIEKGIVGLKHKFRFEATQGLRALDRRELGGETKGPDSSSGVIGSFVIANWPWLWTVMLLPAAAWALRRLANRGESSTEDESASNGQ